MSNSAAGAYHSIIDELVLRSAQSVCADRAESNQPFPVSADHATFNRLIAGLSPEQRADLGAVLRAERRSAIHDALAVLSWWHECEGVGWSQEGVVLPLDQSGMGLHGDFIGRLNGWEWPAR
jgi:hypothetical protein